MHLYIYCILLFKKMKTLNPKHLSWGVTDTSHSNNSATICNAVQVALNLIKYLLLHQFVQRAGWAEWAEAHQEERRLPSAGELLLTWRTAALLHLHDGKQCEYKKKIFIAIFYRFILQRVTGGWSLSQLTMGEGRVHKKKKKECIKMVKRGKTLKYLDMYHNNQMILLKSNYFRLKLVFTNSLNKQGILEIPALVFFPFSGSFAAVDATSNSSCGIWDNLCKKIFSRVCAIKTISSPGCGNIMYCRILQYTKNTHVVSTPMTILSELRGYCSRNFSTVRA